MKKACIFACGGRGTRMGAAVPKQFLRIGGRTVLQLTLEKMAGFLEEARMIVAMPGDCMDFWRGECREKGIGVRHTLVKSGMTRFHSVKNALALVDDDAIVAVHDAVRPLFSAELVERLFAVAEKSGAAAPVVPVVDTVKCLGRNEDGSLYQLDGISADRDILFAAQTPQVFRAGLLKDAYCQAFDTSFTDDASVVRAAGITVHYVEGERYNLKITVPEDLSVVGRLLL